MRPKRSQEITLSVSAMKNIVSVLVESSKENGRHTTSSAPLIVKHSLRIISPRGIDLWGRNNDEKNQLNLKRNMEQKKKVEENPRKLTALTLSSLNQKILPSFNTNHLLRQVLIYSPEIRKKRLKIGE